MIFGNKFGKTFINLGPLSLVILKQKQLIINKKQIRDSVDLTVFAH